MNPEVVEGKKPEVDNSLSGTTFVGAMYVPEQDRIVGCKEGSLVWHHENRHRKQWKDGFASQVNYIASFLGFFTIAYLIIDDKFMAYWCFIIVLACAFLLEIDAWIWGFIDWRRSRS